MSVVAAQMDNASNPVDAPSQPEIKEKPVDAPQGVTWNEEHSALCYHIFLGTEAGRRLMRLWETRFFYEPVAIPGAPEGMAYLNEGRNNFIRFVRESGISQLKGPQSPTNIIRK